MTDQHNPLPPLYKPAIHVPLLKELRWVNQGDYYESTQVLKLLETAGAVYEAHNKVCAAHARKVALEDAKQAVLDWLRPDSEDMRSINDVLKELR